MYLNINENLLIIFIDTYKEYLCELLTYASSLYITMKLIIARILFILEKMI